MNFHKTVKAHQTIFKRSGLRRRQGKNQEAICGNTRGGQQCIFDVFLTKPVGVNDNLGVEMRQRGLNPNPLTNG